MFRIPNPINNRSWRLDHCFVSIATGLLAPHKNIGTLVVAFAMYRMDYPEAELHLVGRYDEHNPRYQQWLSKG